MACIPNRAKLLDTEHNNIGAIVGFRRHLKSITYCLMIQIWKRFLVLFSQRLKHKTSKNTLNFGYLMQLAFVSSGTPICHRTSGPSEPSYLTCPAVSPTSGKEAMRPFSPTNESCD